MPELLKLPKFPKADHVAQMNVRAAGVEAHLKAELLATLHQTDELLLGDDLADATGYNRFQVSWVHLSEAGHLKRSGLGSDGSRPHPVLSA